MGDTPQVNQMTVLRRGRGRPKVVEKTTVCTWMEATHYDQLVKMAASERKTVSSLVRELLLVRLR